MSRRRKAQVRDVAPDPVYGSVVVSKVINRVMLGGEKSKAEIIVYSALESLMKKVGTDSIDCFDQVIDNLKPSIEVKSKRVGGATYQVPVPVRPERSLASALRWLVEYSRSRSDAKIMKDKLYLEMFDAYNKKGSAYKKKEDVRKMAEANKAYSHYVW